jgi:hypothetical protein
MSTVRDLSIDRSRSVRPNDVKKNDIVVLKDGHSVKVFDNQRGIIRCVIRETIFGGGIDIGSMYIDNWEFMVDLQTKELVPISLTDDHKKTMKTVRSVFP